MNPYQQLFTISWSMLQLAKQEDWETFYQAEKERDSLMSYIQDHKEIQLNVSEALLQKILKIHQQLEEILTTEQEATQQIIMGLQKGKKAQQYYQSNKL